MSIPSVHEVRVTMRGVRLTPDGSPVQVSTRSDFIAPDLSPVRTVDLESAKGLRGWTAHDVKVPSVGTTQHTPKGLADRRLDAMTVGTTVVRTTDTRTMRVMNHTGPRRGK